MSNKSNTKRQIFVEIMGAATNRANHYSILNTLRTTKLLSGNLLKRRNDITPLNDIISLSVGSATLNDINYSIKDRQFGLLMINRRLMI